MAFITRCLKSLGWLDAPQRASRLRTRFGVMACLLVCILSFSTAQAQTQPAIELQGLTAERDEAALVLSGKWRFELSNAMQDALLKGVALHFMLEADITRERWYFYEKRISHAERHMRLSYLPLTRRWRLNIANQAITLSGLGVSFGQTFESLEDATSALQRLGQWRVAASSDIENDVNYMLEIKFKLDLTQLPRPLQMGAIGQSDWILAYSKRMPLVVEPVK
jgi:hypothetical protein